MTERRGPKSGRESPFAPEIHAITESDDELRALLDDPGTELPPLLPALAHVLGDPALLPAELKLDPNKVLDEQGGWTTEQQDLCRELALAGLIRLRDEGATDESRSREHLQELIAWLTGGDINGSYAQMLTEELAPNDADLRAPSWDKATLAPERSFRVAVIGAGMSGILIAHRLNQAGIDVVVLEKNDGIGGTWFENTYPGCRVDVSNHVYAYSFMQKHDWPQFHSAQSDLLEYFDQCVDAFEIRDSIRFQTEVEAVVWDEERARWMIEVVGPGGESTLEAHAVVSAVGQLNRPRHPDLAGLESFAGPMWHSANWNHGVDLTGKRVGVIGTGCSAAQLIPQIVDQAAHTTVFQRTPNWLVPRPQYTKSLPESLLWLFTHVPGFHNWFRLRLFWRSHEGLLPRLEVDPDWPEPVEVSISQSNDELRQLLTLYLEVEFGDRPDLLEKVQPRYTMGAKRFVVDNGIWARTLKRDDVQLVTEPIELVEPHGVTTGDGSSHDLDVLILATGFQASSFLMPMKVVGRDGVDLHDTWDGDARAYLGVVSPGFPNLFYMYGPNTNIVINGSIIYFSECEAHYITAYIQHVLAEGLGAMDVKQEVHDRYNDRIDEGNLKMAWGISGVSSWYKTNGGRVAQNWPFSLLEYWEQTRSIDPADYETIPQPPNDARTQDL